MLILNNLILICILLLSFTHLLLNTKNSIKGFQQNAYMRKNYLLWYKNNSYKIFANYWFFILFSIALISNINNEIITIILLLSSLILLIFSGIFKIKLNKVNERIKLVYTARVKRLITTYIVLVVLLLGLHYIVLLKSNILVMNFRIFTIFYIGLIILLNILNPLVVLASNFFNKPIEKKIRNGFINEAKEKINKYPGEVIALTGSYGKTTTKNYLNTLLSESYYTYPTPASFNSTMGITISIRENLKNIHDMFLVELGAKENNDLDDVMEITKPNIAILSSIGPQHLLSFKTLDNIINTKFAIVEQLKSGSKAYINIDNEHISNYNIKNKNIEVITYSVNNDNSNYQVKNIDQNIKGSSFDIYYNGKKINEEKFITSVLGELNLLNICVSIAVAHDKKVPMRKIRLGVKKIAAPEHRLQLRNNGNYVMIDDAYNSNPLGSKQALDVLSKFPGRKIIVTPGMIELGEKQETLNKEFGKYMFDKTDYIILTGTKITPPIYEGIKESGFNMDHVFKVNHISEAFAMLNNLCKNDKENYVLFENDLPDVFM